VYGCSLWQEHNLLIDAAQHGEAIGHMIIDDAYSFYEGRFMPTRNR